MLRSRIARSKQVKVIPAAALASADVNSTAVDVAGFGSLYFTAIIGAFTFTGVNKATIKLQHSDEPSANFADVGAGDLLNPEDAAVPAVVKTLNDAADADNIYSAHYLGYKRYVRLVIDVEGTVTAVVAAIANLADPEQMPPA